MNWNKAKKEYITDESSTYRGLAKKYGVGLSTITRRAKAEDWQGQRTQVKHRVMTKSLDVICDEQVNRAKRLTTVTDKLLAKIEAAVDDLNMQELLVNKQALKQITGALKDIKDIQMIRSDADIREQEARIKALEKSAEKSDDTTQTISVVFASNEEYGK